MMIDYNVRDDWPDDEPTWIKSLVCSLDRRHGSTTTLPLVVVIEEIVDWLELAAGKDAWDNGRNRSSLARDLEESVSGLGQRLLRTLAPELRTFEESLQTLGRGGLTASGGKVLHQLPGQRTDPAWTAATRAAYELQDALASDRAVAACWEDLVDVAHEPRFSDRRHRHIADLLFEQLRLRGHEPGQTFNRLAHTLAADDVVRPSRATPELTLLTGRLESARALVMEVPANEHVVVWLGYVGGRVEHVVAGNVIFMDAHWYVPNATADRQDFVGKQELADITRWSLFRVAERVDEKSDVDVLARVDLGVTRVAGSARRAEAIVDALLSLSVHRSAGIRPLLTEWAIVRNGVLGGSMARTPETSFANDYYGANMTAAAIEEVAPRLGAALAAAPLPRFLAAAVEVQAAADRPHSREMALRRPSDADVRSVIPLEDRVVQHVAAHAGISSAQLFTDLADLWPQSRWRSDVRLAVSICLLGAGPRYEEVNRLRGALHQTSDARPWLVFVAEHEHDLLAVCRVESERGWVESLLRSVSDPVEYRRLMHGYQRCAEVLNLRRARVRNALVHGNPAGMPAVESVGDFASYLSRHALEVGLESFVTGEDVATILSRDRAEMDALLAGAAAADYWRSRAAQTLE